MTAGDEPIERRYPFSPDWVMAPGGILREVLEERGMSQASLADAMGRSAKMVNGIVSRRQPITVETAMRLEAVLGVTAQFWMNLETTYRIGLARGLPDVSE